MCHVTHVVPFRLNPASGVPIAEQAIFQAKKAILSGKLSPGDPFPSVRTLAKELKIHVNTAQKVIAQLADEGFLAVRPGVGTVVASTVRPIGQVDALAADVERLVVKARQIGLPLEDLQKGLAQCWLELASEEQEHDPNATAEPELRQA